jgi:peptidyl-prolyl cis-trans isomerase A (cyclophilin A)
MRNTRLLILLVVLFPPLPGAAVANRNLDADSAPTSETQLAYTDVVVVETNLGNIKVKLRPDKAPKTVANFQRYVAERHYDGLTFHRVIPQFMIQGGGHDATMKEKATHAPIPNESGNGLSNVRGSVAMARTVNLDSATAQFYINLVDNLNLDKLKYCVFGEVIAGIEVVDKIATVQTGAKGQHQNVPGGPGRHQVGPLVKPMNLQRFSTPRRSVQNRIVAWFPSLQ